MGKKGAAVAPASLFEIMVQTTVGERYFSIKIKRMLDVSEKFRGCVIILDDMTEQKHTESSLHETTIWLTEMFNALEEAVFIGTPGGRIVDANKAAQQTFGYTAAELKNRTTEHLHVDHDHFQAFTDRVREALGQGENAGLLLIDCPEDGPYTDRLKKIVAQVDKVGAITKKLMHVTRYETKPYLDQQIIDIEKASRD